VRGIVKAGPVERKGMATENDEKSKQADTNNATYKRERPVLGGNPKEKELFLDMTKFRAWTI
jgi:hypothetical protein